MNKIIKAIQFAIEKHGNQKYGNKPYIYHLVGVADLVARAFAKNENMIVSAILHDVLEDTNCTYEELNINFGKQVANTVFILTKKENQTYEEFIDQIVTCNNDLAINIKIADITFNLANNPKPKNIEKYKKSLEILKKLCPTKI